MSKDILIGVICGLFMSTISLGAMVLFIFFNRDIYDKLAKRLPQGVSPTLVMLFVLIALPLVWSILGAIGGELYNVAIESAAGSGLGSSNQTFTVGILGLAGLLMLPILFLIIKRKKSGWIFFAVNLFFAGIFGWILPLLADWR